MYANTEQAQSVVSRMEDYGVQHDGEVVTQEYHRGVDYADQMTLAEVAAAKGRITRVRILREMGRNDISYVHATLPGCACPRHDGMDDVATRRPDCYPSYCEPSRVVPVRVDMPSSGIGIYTRELKGEFIAWGKEQGVYAKGLGLLDESNWAVLRG
jgi:hypothetical protein